MPWLLIAVAAFILFGSKKTAKKTTLKEQILGAAGNALGTFSGAGTSNGAKATQTAVVTAAKSAASGLSSGSGSGLLSSLLSGLGLSSSKSKSGGSGGSGGSGSSGRMSFSLDGKTGGGSGSGGGAGADYSANAGGGKQAEIYGPEPEYDPATGQIIGSEITRDQPDYTIPQEGFSPVAEELDFEPDPEQARSYAPEATPVYGEQAHVPDAEDFAGWDETGWGGDWDTGSDESEGWDDEAW
jgi:hypothetical protein